MECRSVFIREMTYHIFICFDVCQTITPLLEISVHYLKARSHKSYLSYSMQKKCILSRDGTGPAHTGLRR